MAAQLLDGKNMSNELREKLALRVENLKARGVTPGLAVILVGEDPASQIYVKNKGLGCAQVGMHSVTIRLPETTTQQELETQIDSHCAGKGCGWIPCGQCRQAVHRPERRCCVHAQGCHGDDSPYWYRSVR